MFRYFEHKDGHIYAISEAEEKEIEKFENDDNYEEVFMYRFGE